MLPFVQIFRYIYMFRCIYILFLFLDNILFNYKLIALLVEIVKLFPLLHFIGFFFIKRRILGDACFVFVDHYLNVLLQSKSDKKAPLYTVLPFYLWALNCFSSDWGKDFFLLCDISGKVYERFKQIQEIISSSSIQSTLSSSKALKFKVTVHNMI